MDGNSGGGGPIVVLQMDRGFTNRGEEGGKRKKERKSLSLSVCMNGIGDASCCLARSDRSSFSRVFILPQLLEASAPRTWKAVTVRASVSDNYVHVCVSFEWLLVRRLRHRFFFFFDLWMTKIPMSPAQMKRQG